MEHEGQGRTLAELARRFRLFAEHECRGRSPLYERLSYAIAEDETLLRSAAAARTGQPVPNLFFAAVQFLLLRGERPELARYYRTLGGEYRATDEPFPTFRGFCLAQWDRSPRSSARALCRRRTHAVAPCCCQRSSWRAAPSTDGRWQ
jgi:hypothetical protein